MVDLSNPIIFMRVAIAIIVVSVFTWYVVIPKIIEYIIFMFVCVIGDIICTSIVDAIEYADHSHSKWVYNKYRIHRMKKQFNLIYKYEPFIWTHEQEQEQFRLAFEYATTIQGE